MIAKGCFQPDCNAKDKIIKVVAPDSKCTVFPNPASTVIKLTYKTVGNYVIKVFDLNGSEVFVQKNRYGLRQSIIDVSDWSNGLYIISLSNDNENFYTKVIVYK